VEHESRFSTLAAANEKPGRLASGLSHFQAVGRLVVPAIVVMAIIMAPAIGMVRVSMAIGGVFAMTPMVPVMGVVVVAIGIADIDTAEIKPDADSRAGRSRRRNRGHARNACNDSGANQFLHVFISLDCTKSVGTRSL
jgi:hypothetical protein